MARSKSLDPDHPTGAQLRAARGLLNLSVKEVAERTGLVPNTIKRAERTNDLAPITRANARLLVREFTDLGVLFTPSDSSAGAGVRMRLGVEFKGSRKRRASDDDSDP